MRVWPWKFPISLKRVALPVVVPYPISDTMKLDSPRWEAVTIGCMFRVDRTATTRAPWPVIVPGMTLAFRGGVGWAKPSVQASSACTAIR